MIQETDMSMEGSNKRNSVYMSASHDVTVNLATEEWLLKDIPEGEEILFLYENNMAVVIGRSQNPWRECRTGLAKRRGIAIRRRISGGGTVVHGEGNLNYSIISGRRWPRKEVNLDRIIRALGTLGLRVQRNERCDLLVEPPDNPTGMSLKVGGSAFRLSSRSSMHHGTLLVNANLDMLRKLLHVPPRQIEAKGVRSTPSAVCNLADVSGAVMPRLTVSDVVDALCREWGGTPFPDAWGLIDEERGESEYQNYIDRLASEEWIWGKTPDFRERFSKLPELGNAVLEFEVRAGRIESIAIIENNGKPLGEIGALKGLTYQGSTILSSPGAAPERWVYALAGLVDGDFLDPQDDSAIGCPDARECRM